MLLYQNFPLEHNFPNSIHFKLRGSMEFRVFRSDFELFTKSYLLFFIHEINVSNELSEFMQHTLKYLTFFDKNIQAACRLLNFLYQCNIYKEFNILR